MSNPPPAPPKDRWEVHFVKVNKGGHVIREKTFTCTVEDYGAANAVQEAVDLMIDKVDVEDAGYMRVCKMVNLSLAQDE